MDRLVILLGVFELDQLRGLLGYGRGATDEDQTLLWYAGRELLHLHLHEPNFFGQNYNTTFEAIPGRCFTCSASRWRWPARSARC